MTKYLLSELLDIAANLPLPHTSISPRTGIADSINTDSFKEGENDATTAHQSATTAASTPIPIPSIAHTASGSLPALIGTHYEASPQRVSVAANGNREEDSEISQVMETAVSNRSKADTDIIQRSTFPSDDELGSTESDRSHDCEKETQEDNEYSDNKEYEDEHTVDISQLHLYDIDLPMRFGSESTMVSAEALIAIRNRVQGLQHDDAKITALVLDTEDSIWEATPRGLILGRMGPVAQGLYAIESLHQMNMRAQQVITYEHRKISINNRNIYLIHKQIKEARMNAALYNELRSKFQETSKKVGHLRQSNHHEQQGHGVALTDGLLGYSKKRTKPKVGSTGTAIHPAGRRIHHSQPTGRHSTSSAPSVHASPSRILSSSEHNHVQAFHTVGTPNAIRYETPEMHLISPVPLSGVKELYANNNNDEIEEDEPDMMELLGK